MESVFSLGATNALENDFGDEEEDKQTTEENNATWHRNTIRVFEVLKRKMAPESSGQDNVEKLDMVSYNDLSQGVTRRTAAAVFFEILQLKTLNFIELNQEEPFGDIIISPGVKFMEDPPMNVIGNTSITSPKVTE